MAALIVAALVVSRLQIDLGDVWSALRRANPWLLALGFLAYYATFPVRAARWRLLLLNSDVAAEASRPLPAVLPLTGIVLRSWFVNCVVPAKLGDAYRGYALKRGMGASFGRVLGSVIAERLLDVLALVTLMILAGLAAFHGAVPSDLRWWFVAGAALALLGIGALVVLIAFGGALQRMFPPRLRPHVERVRHGIVMSFGRVGIRRVATYTLLIWSLEGARMYCVALAFGVGLSPAQSLLVALLASLLTTFPVTPAGLGAVEGGIVVALKLFDVGASTGGAVALVDRGITYWSMIALGGLAWLIAQRRVGPAGNVMTVSYSADDAASGGGWPPSRRITDALVFTPASRLEPVPDTPVDAD